MKTKLQESGYAEKNNAGIKYADNFYLNNGLGCENEKACILNMMNLLDLDFDSCMLIQRPVYSFHNMCEMKNIGRETIYNHHNTVAGILQNVSLGNVTTSSPKLDIQQGNTVGKKLLKAFFGGHKTAQEDDIITLSFDGIKDQSSKDPRHKAVVGTILKINDDTRYTENSISNKTKVISMTNCGLVDYDMHCFEPLFGYKLDLDYFSVADNCLKTPSSILTRIHHANLYYKGCNIKHINFSNNNFGNDAALLLASQMTKGNLGNLESLDIHGNNIDKKGGTAFKNALEHPDVKDVVITMTHVNTMKDAVSFFSSWFDSKIIEYKQNSAESPWNTKAFATDQASLTHCQKTLGLTSGGIALGVVKQSAKKVSPLKLFYAVLRDGGPDEILNPDLLPCIGNIWIDILKPQNADEYGQLLGEDASHCEIF